MTVDEPITAGRFKRSVKFFQRGMLNLKFYTALTTDQVVVIISCNFVDQMPTTRMSKTD